MRYENICSLIVGGLISLFTSISLLIVQRIIDRRGNLLIFYRMFYPASNTKKIYFKKNDEIIFNIQVLFDLQNTSNSSKVMRDINILLYKDNKYVAKMKRSYLAVQKEGNKLIREDKFGNEQNSYSITIPPRGIQTLLFDFLYDIKQEEIQKYDFNNIILEYHDDKNKRHVLKMREIKNCWKEEYFENDIDWILVK